MFKFNIPVTIILSSGSLILLAIGSLLFVGNTAYTSNVNVPADTQALNEHHLGDNLSTTQQVAQDEARNVSTDTRRRNGRLYSSPGYGGQQQASMDSYAAAYAVANSPAAGEHSSDIGQSSVQSSDSGSYSSFGEPSPSVSSSSSGSAARQLPSSDYAPHSSYYSSYMSPSSTSGSYGSQLASGSNHHSHHYPYYHKSPPLGYPTNGYDRHTAASNYYDRSYLGTSALPHWASSPSSGGLMSSASTALSSWTSGFSIAEIICGLIALSIGAVILGAPFFLIYLALMGNFSGSGTLSLTNPTGTTTPAGGAATVNGRRKRLAIFEQLSSTINPKRSSEFSALADAVVNQLSPFVDFQQVTSTFKRLVESIDKYSNMKPEATKKKSA